MNTQRAATAMTFTLLAACSSDLSVADDALVSTGQQPLSADQCARTGGTYVSGYLGADRSLSQQPTEGSVFVERCLFTIPGTTCGLDPLEPGLPAGAPLNTLEPDGADSIAISVMGGGACWSAGTCGLVGPLPLATNTRNAPDFWISNVAQTPFVTSSHGVMDSSYRQYEIPYCTGDIHLGDNVATYGGPNGATPFRHKGFQNFSRYLDFIKSRNPNPRKILVVGESAGALALNGNLKQIRDRWPKQPLSVVLDSGMPYSKVFFGSQFEEALTNWGTVRTIPTIGKVSLPDPMDGLRYNVARYATDPTLRFGLIQPYSDVVLYGFGLALQLDSPPLDSFHAITQTAFEVMKPTRNFKINAFDEVGPGAMHVCYAACPQVFPTKAAEVDAWVQSMVSGKSGWANVVPRKP